MSNSGPSRSDRNRNSDEMHRQSSRPTNNSEEVVVAVDTNDLFENETMSIDNRSYRRSDNSRREHSSSSKRSNESSSQYRSTRHSSPPPPPSNSHKRHYSSQRNSSPAAPPSSSRYQRSSRPTSSTLKRSRSRSRSRSSHERPTHRTRTQQIEENSSTKKLPPPNENPDLSTISEDESTKPIEPQRSTRPKVENSSTPISHKTNDVRLNPNETILETSQTGQDYDLSLFPNSILSASSTAPPPPPPTTTTAANDLLQAIDLLSRYKTMQSMPSNDPLIIACEKEILQLIQKKIDLQKKELEINERAMKIRERELIEVEKRFQPTTSIVETTPIEKEDQAEKIPLETSNNEMMSDESTRLTRKNGGKSRFSAPIDVEPTVTIPSDETTERAATFHPDAEPTIESQPSISLIDAELKVISTNSCRKVEIQSGTSEKKNSSDDLRYTISKNRSKQIETSDNETNGNRIISDDEQKITINQIIPSTKDEKSSISSTFDFHSQRSFTSTSEIIDEHSTHDKRRSQTRTARRQQSYSNERSNFSTSQPSRYATNSKRYENEDLRSHLYENKTSKSSRK